MPIRCRIFGHKWRDVDYEGRNYGRNATREDRFTSRTTERCLRCGLTQVRVNFDSRGYWDDFSREIEDRRLEETIRRALR